MLEKLLAEIQKGNTTSPTVLAERLNLSTSMVQAMLSTLEEQGYLKTISNECNSEKPCGSCPVANLCTSSSGENPRIRVLNTPAK
jgi:DNA-binding Lrp family transcriptional regulator